MLIGVLSLLGVYLAVLLLHLVLPARRVEGYVTDAAGGRLRYRLNGLLVFVVMVGGFVALATAGILPWNFLYLHRFTLLATAFVLGLLFTFAVVLPAPTTGKPLLVELYLGRLENPQWLSGRVDAAIPRPACCCTSRCSASSSSIT